MIALVCGNSKITVRYVLPDAFYPSMSLDVLKRPMTLFAKMAGRNAKKRTGTASQFIAGAGCRWRSLCFYKSGGSTGNTCLQSLGVETMRLSHGGASAPSDALSLQVFLSGSFHHSPSISANVIFRPVLSKKRDRVVHKSTFSVACPVASDLSAIRFCPLFCAECRKKPDILRHPVSKIGRGDRI